ncbi:MULTISPECIES: DUF3460 family protein [Chitinibacter]|uniref:DUF3460 family protein n=1 Tax=Chitinibacter TaxID=230666 RepID=UPI001E4FDC48|nr:MULTISPECIES: DUF3460 family protein [Chitinibacter]
MFDRKYVSEYTQFMNQFLQENPEVAKGQLEGRALLWDKAPIDLDERKRNDESRVNK